jgi:predicted RNA-binding protein with RPS1 domain
MNTKKITQFEDGSWEAIASHDRKTANPEILAKYGVKIFNNQPYALDYFEKVFLGSEPESKEPRVGESRRIVGISGVNEKEIQVTLSGFIDATIDVRSEKHFLGLLNVTAGELIEWLSEPENRESFLSNGYTVIVETIKPYVKASISKGHTLKIKNEFFEQISKPSSAYYGKIKEKNGGGFIINVQGVDGFLPGSLAATNIVRDFDSMIGKEIPVMVEDYLKDSDTFVFSYKKYVNYIISTKIDDLDLEKKYTGTVTGAAKYGIFVEFEEFFTGLIHTSKMTPEFSARFSKGELKPGNVVEFWIKEITNDKKIILTDEDPSIRRNELEEFKKDNLGKVKNGEVISIQPFGTLVKLQKDIVGLISQKEIKSKKKNFVVGDTVSVTVDRVHNDKIFLSLPNED